jgi:hypothetical protein
MVKYRQCSRQANAHYCNRQSVETYKGTMPAKLYWSLVRHANCSPERRTEAFKLTEDSAYETGARCLLQWIRNNESKFWRNDAFRDDLEVDLERAVRAAGRS